MMNSIINKIYVNASTTYKMRTTEVLSEYQPKM